VQRGSESEDKVMQKSWHIFFFFETINISTCYSKAEQIQQYAWCQGTTTLLYLYMLQCTTQKKQHCPTEGAARKTRTAAAVPYMLLRLKPNGI